MKKVVNIGHRNYGQIFCKIEIKNGNLSIIGVEGPVRSGNCKGSCGQIVMDMIPEEIIPQKEWTTELIKQFLTTWERWHLNDMRAGCEHQRDWDVSKKVETVELTWGETYYKARSDAASGELNWQEYKAFQSMQVIVDRYSRCKFVDKNIQMAIDAGIFKIQKTNKESVGHLRFDEHPKGLLCKPCPVCGYKYGTKWLKEELPQEVIDFLESLPTTTITPAWV